MRDDEWRGAQGGARASRCVCFPAHTAGGLGDVLAWPLLDGSRPARSNSGGTCGNSGKASTFSPFLTEKHYQHISLKFPRGSPRICNSELSERHASAPWQRCSSSSSRAQQQPHPPTPLCCPQPLLGRCVHCSRAVECVDYELRRNHRVGQRLRHPPCLS
jgi:hypothetical protein